MIKRNMMNFFKIAITKCATRMNLILHHTFHTLDPWLGLGMVLNKVRLISIKMLVKKDVVERHLG